MVLSPGFKNVLINNYIGKEIYEKLHTETKKVLIISFVQYFKQDMEYKFGSLSAYNKWVIQRNGFEGWSDYNNFLAQRRGFKNAYDYRNCCIKRKGFKSIGQYLNQKAQEKGFKNRWEYEKSLMFEKGKSDKQIRDERAQRKGFKNLIDRSNCRARKKGFISYSGYVTYMQKQRNRENKRKGLCAKCGGKRTNSDFVTCESCRKYMKEYIKQRKLMKENIISEGELNNAVLTS